MPDVFRCERYLLPEIRRTDYVNSHRIGYCWRCWMAESRIRAGLSAGWFRLQKPRIKYPPEFSVNWEIVTPRGKFTSVQRLGTTDPN